MKIVHLPVLCKRCARIQLQPVRPGETPNCRSCGAPGSVLPGESYSESDSPIFDRIEACFRSAQLSPATLERIVGELRSEARRLNAPEAVLLRVVELLPTLDFLIVGLRSNVEPRQPHALTRMTGMLLTIASSRATLSRSGPAD